MNPYDTPRCRIVGRRGPETVPGISSGARASLG